MSASSFVKEIHTEPRRQNTSALEAQTSLPEVDEAAFSSGGASNYRPWWFWRDNPRRDKLSVRGKIPFRWCSPDANNFVSKTVNDYIELCHERQEISLANQLTSHLVVFQNLRLSLDFALPYFAIDFSSAKCSSTDRARISLGENPKVKIDWFHLQNFETLAHLAAGRDSRLLDLRSNGGCLDCTSHERTLKIKRVLFIVDKTPLYPRVLGLFQSHFLTREQLLKIQSSFHQVTKTLIAAGRNVEPKSFHQMWCPLPDSLGVQEVLEPPNEDSVSNKRRTGSSPDGFRHITLRLTADLLSYGSNWASILLEPYSTFPDFNTIHVTDDIFENVEAPNLDWGFCILKLDQSVANKFLYHFWKLGTPFLKESEFRSRISDKVPVTMWDETYYSLDIHEHLHMNKPDGRNHLHQPLREVVQLIANVLCLNHNLVGKALKEQQIAGRTDPSHGRLNYLLYLANYTKSLELDVASVEKALKILKADAQDAKWANSMEDYMEDLRKCRRDLLDCINDTKKLIRERLDARSSYWTRVIGFGGAVYVALSFTTGIYGMNIHEINYGKPTWWTVVATGISATALTVVIPLAFGEIYRIIHRFMKIPAIKGLSVVLAKIFYWSSRSTVVFFAGVIVFCVFCVFCVSAIVLSPILVPVALLAGISVLFRNKILSALSWLGFMRLEPLD